ncbi:hypothetical protein OG792_05715 [Micromonospora sp. NBC_01699]|uniref:CATRA system-associated protein n=1 Tax=Micromonospora sp. NBC_01699 TaxID=2975984 RepID=UPI002E3788FC|nr:CATRA system-associated protein [Micromonospora sp. NBC_01699]
MVCWTLSGGCGHWRVKGAMSRMKATNHDQLLRNLREILVDLVRCELPPSAWDRVERSITVINTALSTSEWSAISTETAVLESVVPSRARPLDSPPEPVSASLRERISTLIHRVDQKWGEDDGGKKRPGKR